MSHSTLPKSWLKEGWVDLGSDVNWKDYHGMWGKPAPHELSVWYVIQFTNMIDACGERGAVEMGFVYEAQLKLVDLEAVSKSAISLVQGSFGFDNWLGMKPAERILALVYGLVSDGVCSPMHTETGKTGPSKVRLLAKREADILMADGSKRQRLLARPINPLGTTAAELGNGDVLAGLRRSAEQAMEGKPVDPKASIALRCYAAAGGQTLGGSVETDLAIAGLLLKKE